MNKTVVYSFAIVTFGITILGCVAINSKSKIALKSECKFTKTFESQDRFNSCMKIVMEESRQSDKSINANEAKAICVEVKNKD